MEYINEIAQSLLQAEQNRTAIKPIIDTNQALTIEQAYQISKAVLDLRSQRDGVRVVGRKVGITSKAVQQWLKVDQPDFGYITNDRVISDPGVLSSSVFIQPRIEGEIAFILKHDLAGPGLTATDIIRATDFILPALEVVDSRIENWQITIQDTVADNASSGYCVLGQKPVLLSELDLSLAGMSLYENGRVGSTGTGAACLGHPVNAVVWLANTLGQLGEVLKAGEIIMSGALGPVLNVKENNHYRMVLAGIGDVSCYFTD